MQEIAETPLELHIREAVTNPLLNVSADVPPLSDDDIAALPEPLQSVERERMAELYRRTRARELYRDWQRRYLIQLRLCAGVAGLACQRGGVSIATVRKYREADPVFDEDCRAVTDAALDIQEAALHVSGSIGDVRPIYQGGEQVGEYRVKSERAALALLAADRSARFGTKPAEATVNLSLPSPESVRDAMRRLAGIETPPVETVQTIEDKPVAAIETGQ